MSIPALLPTVPSPTAVHANQYDDFADAYVATVQRSVVNATIERPLVLDLLGDVRGRRILDVGCGASPLGRLLVERGAAVVGIDGSTAMLRIAAASAVEGLALVAHDLNEPLPFADASFDAVTASFVLHYLEDWRAVLAELARVLRPGGVIVATTHHPVRDSALSPTGSYLSTELVEERWHLGTSDHAVRFWRRPLAAMFAAIADAGLVVDQLREPPAPGETTARLLALRLRSSAVGPASSRSGAFGENWSQTEAPEPHP